MKIVHGECLNGEEVLPDVAETGRHGGLLCEDAGESRRVVDLGWSADGGAALRGSQDLYRARNQASRVRSGRHLPKWRVDREHEGRAASGTYTSVEQQVKTMALIEGWTALGLSSTGSTD